MAKENEEILHTLVDIKKAIDRIIKELIIQDHARRIEALERKVG